MFFSLIGEIRKVTPKTVIPQIPPQKTPVSAPLLHDMFGYSINIRSLCDPLKYNFVHDLLSSEKPSFLGITETWLTDSPGSVAALATPGEFTFFHHNPRTENRGGGVAFVCNTKLCPKLLSIGTYPSFESLVVQTKYPKPCIFSVIYRPDKKSTIKVFINDFTDFISKLSCFNKPLILMGDFNIHLNKTSRDVSNFLEILDIFDLKQFISSPTHCHGNILDLVISSETITSIEISDPTSIISDHFLLKFTCTFVSTTNNTPTLLPISYRKTRQINPLLLQK